MFYHVNPSTQRPNQCKAQSPESCPYASKNSDGSITHAPHFESKAEAREFVERENKKKYKGLRNLTKDFNTEILQREYVLTPYGLDNLKKKVSKINERLEKAGSPSRASFTAVEEYIIDESSDEFNAFKLGVIKEPPRRLVYNVEAKLPPVVYEGYTFEAVAEQSQSGILVKSFSRSSGWRPEKLECDHCGQQRQRKKVFLLKTPEGNTVMVGASCVKDFIGFNVNVINNYYSFDENIDDEDKMARGKRVPSYLNTRDVLRLALAVTKHGEEYKSIASTSIYGGASTSAVVFNVLFPAVNDDNIDLLNKKIDEVPEELVDEVIQQVKNTEGSHDYIENLKILVNNDYVSSRNIPLLVSSLSLRLKKKNSEKKKKEWAKGFMGDVKSSIKGKKAKVVSNKIIQGRSYSYYNDTIEKSLVTMQDEDGHQVVWFASDVVNFQNGDEVEFTGGSVKKHGVFNGVDQTIVTRVKANVLESEEESEKGE